MSNGAPAADYGRNLLLRTASALVLAPVALIVAYIGGLLFAIFWAGAAIAVFWEWNALVGKSGKPAIFLAGASALALAAIAAERGFPATAILIVALGAFSAAGLAAADRRLWIGAGVGYAGVLLVAPMMLRYDADYGFSALAMLFAIVWSTDIIAYFTGRMIGGPKLAPAISPKKTWSGAIGGTAGALVIALIVAANIGIGSLAAVAMIALVLSVSGQIGDLLESAIKRRFEAKDTGRLIPGHGGVMDRLDAFWCAALVAALIGVARAGFDASARGLMIW